LTIRSIGVLKVGLGLVALSGLNISSSAGTSSISNKSEETQRARKDEIKSLPTKNNLKRAIRRTTTY